jgi:hypothetical protein
MLENCWEHYLAHCRWQQGLSMQVLNESIAKSIAKAQGHTVTKNYLDLRLE